MIESSISVRVSGKMGIVEMLTKRQNAREKSKLNKIFRRFSDPL